MRNPFFEVEGLDYASHIYTIGVHYPPFVEIHEQDPEHYDTKMGAKIPEELQFVYISIKRTDKGATYEQKRNIASMRVYEKDMDALTTALTFGLDKVIKTAEEINGA